MVGFGSIRKAGAVGKEFRDFLLKTNMFSMAMGVVIGTAVSKVVESIVKDLIMPFVGVLKAEGDWRALKGGFWRFNWTYGNFFGALVDFLIIALVVFLITKAFVKQTPAPPSKTCAQCLEAIHVDAKRCKWCTSEVAGTPS